MAYLLQLQLQLQLQRRPCQRARGNRQLRKVRPYPAGGRHSCSLVGTRISDPSGQHYPEKWPFFPAFSDEYFYGYPFARSLLCPAPDLTVPTCTAKTPLLWASALFFHMCPVCPLNRRAPVLHRCPPGHTLRLSRRSFRASIFVQAGTKIKSRVFPCLFRPPLLRSAL